MTSFRCSCGFQSDASSTFYQHVVVKAEEAPGETHTRIFSTPDITRSPATEHTMSSLSPMPMRPTSSGSHIATPSPLISDRREQGGASPPSPLVAPRWQLGAGSFYFQPQDETLRRAQSVKTAIHRTRQALDVISVSPPPTTDANVALAVDTFPPSHSFVKCVKTD